MNLDIKHLEHVKEDILLGIKSETRDSILSKYSISDQLNATGQTATAMRTEIGKLITHGKNKSDLVAACTTFEELEAVIPRKD
ncbi:hypothetical protein [Ilumatobacter sp.]|uniref:hypothetical protein n=1 Tax=Ilumatobacter sp. TaxID=1967498 RepID=UPI0037531AAF